MSTAHGDRHPRLASGTCRPRPLGTARAIGTRLQSRNPQDGDFGRSELTGEIVAPAADLVGDGQRAG